jgi:hypothetical protein
MNDEEFELQKKRIQVLTERWVKPLGMNWGRIHFVYHRDSGDFQEQREKYCDTSKDGSGRGLAFCTSDWRYAESTIQFNLLVVAGEDDDALEEFYVHHEERVATTLAKAFVWLRDALLEKREQPAISSEVPTC